MEFYNRVPFKVTIGFAHRVPFKVSFKGVLHIAKPNTTQVIVDSEWENFKLLGLPYLFYDGKFKLC